MATPNVKTKTAISWNDQARKLKQHFTTLTDEDLYFEQGKMVDASFVKVPRQRNTREENKHIKETGKAPHEWKVKPHKLAQKDHDCLRRYFVVTSYGAVAYRERRGTTALCG